MEKNHALFKQAADRLRNVHPDDVWNTTFPTVDWNDPARALDDLYRFLIHHCESNIDWYLGRKKEKKRGALCVRGILVATGILAAAIPAVIGIFPDSSTANFAPLASLCAALAAICVGADRYFGFSTGWTRYMATELQLQTRLRNFQFQWLQDQFKHRNRPLTDDIILVRLMLLINFSEDIDKAVNIETLKWVEEFQGSMPALEKFAESQRQQMLASPQFQPPGGIKVTFDDSVQLDGGTWHIQLGTRPGQPVSSTTFVDNDLTPGPLNLRVTGILHGKPIEINDLTIIPPSNMAQVVLKLPPTPPAAGSHP